MNTAFNSSDGLNLPFSLEAEQAVLGRKGVFRRPDTQLAAVFGNVIVGIQPGIQLFKYISLIHQPLGNIPGHKNEPIGVWLYPARNNDGIWGYVNYRGEWAIKPIYEYAQEFVGDRYNRCAVVKIDGSWGCVNDRGKYVVDPKFPFAGQAVRAGFDWRKSK